MSDLVLYTYFRSSSSQRVRIALHAKKLAFESRFISLIKDGGEQNTQNYALVNPAHQVPVLVHGENRLAQSMAIIQYIDLEFPQTSLFPSQSFERAKMIEFCEIINSGMQPFHNLKTLQHLERNFLIDSSQKKNWIHEWLKNGFLSLERIAESRVKLFAFGDSITAADCFLAPQITAAERFEFELSPFPSIQKLAENYKSQEVFIKSHPFSQPDCPENLRFQ